MSRGSLFGLRPPSSLSRMSHAQLRMHSWLTSPSSQRTTATLMTRASSQLRGVHRPELILPLLRTHFSWVKASYGRTKFEGEEYEHPRSLPYTRARTRLSGTGNIMIGRLRIHRIIRAFFLRNPAGQPACSAPPPPLSVAPPSPRSARSDGASSRREAM